MKGSITSAGAIVQGLKGWVARRRASARADIEEPEVVLACGQRIAMEGSKIDARREFTAQQDRWPLGPGHENFS